MGETHLVLALEAMGFGAPYRLNEATPWMARAQARYPKVIHQEPERSPVGSPLMSMDGPPRQHGFLRERISCDNRHAATCLENLHPDLTPFISAAEGAPSRAYRNNLTAGVSDGII